MRAGQNIQGANLLGWSGQRDWVQAAEASNCNLELERRWELTCKVPQARQGRTQLWQCAVNRLVVGLMEMHRRQEDM